MRPIAWGIGKSDAEWRDSAQTAALGVNAGFNKHKVFTEIRVGDCVPKIAVDLLQRLPGKLPLWRQE